MPCDTWRCSTAFPLLVPVCSVCRLGGVAVEAELVDATQENGGLARAQEVYDALDHAQRHRAVSITVAVGALLAL